MAQKLGLTISGFLLKYEEMARKTKKQIAKIQQRYRIAALTLDIFVLTLVFFNFALTLNNSWDDLNLLTICLLPAVAVLSFIISAVNVHRHAASHRVIVPAISTVLISSVFFFYVFCYPSIMAFAK